MTSRVDVARRMTGRSTAALTAAVLITVVGLSWWQIVTDARAMCCMVDGLVQAGRAMPFDTGPVHFTGMWTVMLAAMMLPGIVPAAVEVRDRGGLPLGGFALASGYLVVWIPTAVIAFGALTVLNEVSQPSAGLNRLGGVVFAIAGAYQFTGAKRRLVTSFDQPPGTAGAFSAGLSHGVRCVGASWALMSLLLVVGVMNLTWMAAIGVICFAEKAFPRRSAVVAGVGVVLVAIGLVILVGLQALDVVAQIG
jgi:predicted metal-binding membrane protein